VNSCDYPESATFAFGDLPAGRGHTVALSVFVRELPDGSLVGVEAFASSTAAGQQSVERRSVVARRAPAFELSIVGDHGPASSRIDSRYLVPSRSTTRSMRSPGA